MPLVGYARVSTEDQTPLPQSQALKSAGCAEIHEEQASGGNRARPVLTRVLERIGKGDTLVVVRIDRLARSLSHLLEVIERLEAKGAFFRSIEDPIDTASPQGKFTLQVLGAAAEFERALICERTKAGLASARTKGRVGGNPGLRAKDPAALRKVRLARQDGYMERLNETAQDWVPHVRRLRPDMAWEDVLRIINGPLPEARRWTQSRLLGEYEKVWGNQAAFRSSHLVLIPGYHCSNFWRRVPSRVRVRVCSMRCAPVFDHRIC
jgi:DNA invertase Pin-like site-specific DNA recombinase